MHELSIMEEMLAIALAYAHQEQSCEIQRIHMRVGVLSGVVPEALQFAFEAIAPGTIAERGELVIERISVRCYCAACTLVFEPLEAWSYECPQCHRYTVDIRQGQELELVSLEVA
jgi:hydrogenase nickel incorporation protein HypA/HybF